MSGQAKLTLLLELKKKLFDNKLMEAKAKLNKTVDSMKGKINQLKVNHLQAFSAMRNESSLFGRAMDLIGNPYTLIAAGLLAVGALFVGATSKAKEFNHEFLQIQNLNLDKSKGQIADYKKEIRDAAFENGTNLKDTTKTFYDLQSATGLYGKNAEEVFNKVAKYSKATGAELGESMNATTKAMKAFGFGANDIDAYLKSNAKTVQVGITNFEELARVQTEYAGAAAGAGQTFDTANKIFAAFTSIAKDSNMAANLTKTAFQGLSQESTIKGLKSIKVSMYDAKGNMRDLSDVLMDVSEKFKKMTPKQIDQLINKIGGPEGLRALFIKLKTGADDFYNTLSTFDASQFSLDAAYNNAMNDAQNLSDVVKNRLNIVLARLGEKLLPIVEKLLIGIDNVLQWLWVHWDDLGDVIESFGIGVVAATGYLAIFKLMSIASAIASGGLTAALVLVQIALHGIKVAIFSIPIVGWILLAVTAIALIVKKTEGWRAQWDNLVKFFKAIFKAFLSDFKWRWDTLVNGFMIGLNKIKEGWYKFKLAVGLGNDVDNKKALEQIKADTEARKKEIIDGAKDIKSQYTDAFKGLEFKLKWKSKKESEKEDPLLTPPSDGIGSPSGDNNGGGGNNTSNDINSVTGNAQAARNITINIDSFVKGGINTHGTVMQKMNTEELERFFNEMFLRITRNVEMS